MTQKTAIHEGLEQIAMEMLQFIRESAPAFRNGWVPATYIKRELALNMLCYPKGGKQHGPKGWLFSILARMLEDKQLLEYNNDRKHAYYRAMG
jgi:hypothetical protein